MFFKETLPFLHNNIQSFGFLVVLGEGIREKENKDPRDEMLAVLTHFEGKHSYKKEGNYVVNLQLEGKNRVLT